MNEKLDLRIQKTYMALHNAFTQLLEEKKFEDFTVNELCERAIIRRTTFYKHFADKYEYYAFYIKEVCAEFQKQLSPEAMNGNAYFLHMCRELLHFIRKNDRLVQNVKKSSMFPVLLMMLLEQIRGDVIDSLRRVKHSRPMDTTEIEGIAAFYAGGLLSTLFQMLNKDAPIDEDRFIGIVSNFLIDDSNAPESV